MDCESCKSQRVYVNCFDCKEFHNPTIDKFFTSFCQACDQFYHPNLYQTNAFSTPTLTGDSQTNSVGNLQHHKSLGQLDMLSPQNLKIQQTQNQIKHSPITQGLSGNSGSGSYNSFKNSKTSKNNSYRQKGNQLQNQFHLRILICSECEEKNSQGYCADCEQFMCNDCSKLIHNKGARIRHTLDTQKMLTLGFCSDEQAIQAIENNKKIAKEISQQKQLSQNQSLGSIKGVNENSQNKKSQQSNQSSNQFHRSVHTTKPDSNSYSSNSNNQGALNQTFLPIYQPILVDHDHQLTLLLLLLRDQAQQGNLLLPYEQLIPLIQEQLQLSNIQQARDLLFKAEQKGYINITVRQFGSTQSSNTSQTKSSHLQNGKVLTLISMRMTFISFESLLWVLKSLQMDEMAPNERAVQSRVKEAYGIKISSYLWEIILEFIFQDQHSYISEDKALSIDLKAIIQSFGNSFAPQDSNLQYEFRYAKQYDKIEIVYNKFIVEAQETEDNTQASSKTFNLFIQGHEYEGLDQSLMKDYPNELDLYDVFKKFLEDYFFGKVEFQLENQQDEVLQKLQKISIQRANQKQANKSTYNKKSHQQDPDPDFNEDGRAITGGRYGCAQFVKVCGPELIRNQSLGRLAQMVQRSINEDYLRYQKTLIFLTGCIDKSRSDSAQPSEGTNFDQEQLSYETQLRRAEKGAKLQTVKQAIMEVLAEQKGKVQLPQLPNLLRKKLPFKLDYNQLGFAKLKDLINTMSNEIKLELIGPNHTLAYLILSGRYHHENGHSDDIQNIPRDKGFYDQTQKHLSIDINQQRDVMSNPFADNNLQIILNAFYQMLMENPYGIESTVLINLVSKHIGVTFDFKEYGCHSLYEFIKKFVMPTIDLQITNNKPDIFTIRSNKVMEDHNNQNYNRSGSQSSKSLNHSNSQSSISSQSLIHNQNNSPQNIQQSQQLVSNQIQMSGRKVVNGRNAGMNHYQSFQGIIPTQINPIMIDNQYYQQNFQGQMIQGLSKAQQESIASNSGNLGGGGDLKRVPSTQTYIPGPSSFYGKANTSQTNTHLNISHFKNDFDGEISSQNQRNPSQTNYPSNRHQYHMSYDQFTLQQKKIDINPAFQQPNFQPSQLNPQIGIRNPGTFETIPEIQLNHRINHSHSGGPILQRNFLHQSPFFERPFSVDTHNEQRSRSNSPHHNKTISYLNMGSANSSVDFTSNPLTFHSGPPNFFQTQFTSNYHTHKSSMQVHQEESRESSLGTSDMNSQKDQQQRQNDLQIDNNDDTEGGLGFHSERIEDLLEDHDQYEDMTTAHMKSVEELSVKTTVVHSHQLSKGSINQIIPGSFISSGQTQQMHYGHHAQNQSSSSPYSRGGDDYEDHQHLLQQNRLMAQQQAHQQQFQIYNMHPGQQQQYQVSQVNPMQNYHLPGLYLQQQQLQHNKALSEDLTSNNLKNQLLNNYYYYQDHQGNNVPLRINQQQKLQNIIIPQKMQQQQQQHFVMPNTQIDPNYQYNVSLNEQNKQQKY
eukprot:403356177